MENRPFAIRLAEDERQQLERAAGSKPLGFYIRDRLLGSDAPRRKSYRSPKANDAMLAHILARLGPVVIMARSGVVLGCDAQGKGHRQMCTRILPIQTHASIDAARFEFFVRAKLRMP